MAKSPAPLNMKTNRPTLSIEKVQEIVQAEVEKLALVAQTGLLSDLINEWDTEIIFDCGTMNITLAELDATILD